MPQDLYVLQSRILSTEEVITANIFPVIPMFLFISIDSHFALAKRSDNCKCSNDKNNNGKNYLLWGSSLFCKKAAKNGRL